MQRFLIFTLTFILTNFSYSQINTLKKKLTGNNIKEWHLISAEEYLGQKCTNGTIRLTFIARDESGKWDTCIQSKYQRVGFTWDIYKREGDFRYFLKIKYESKLIAEYEIQFINKRLRLTQITESKKLPGKKLLFK